MTTINFNGFYNDALANFQKKLKSQDIYIYIYIYIYKTIAIFVKHEYLNIFALSSYIINNLNRYIVFN